MQNGYGGFRNGASALFHWPLIVIGQFSSPMRADQKSQLDDARKEEGHRASSSEANDFLCVMKRESSLTACLMSNQEINAHEGSLVGLRRQRGGEVMSYSSVPMTEFVLHTDTVLASECFSHAMETCEGKSRKCIGELRSSMFRSDTASLQEYYADITALMRT
ncbi:hypothetical protein F2P81_015400 [Scophthalmus maximus]|uniref:Uncharacterized protein n=1 Tax=Scophthalmus maximus TaxID=52904 RepID=A0A6A4SMH1_SCOMX|nr:hypothetical protein F2P81_015400 [Scophthalmus maximus]